MSSNRARPARLAVSEATKRDFWKLVGKLEAENELPELTTQQWRTIERHYLEAAYQLLQWRDHYNICATGFYAVATSPARSWKAYAQLHWKDRGFKEWCNGHRLWRFMHPTPVQCPTCGHTPPKPTGNWYPLNEAWAAGLTFPQFLAKHPTFEWPAYPITTPAPQSAARTAKRKAPRRTQRARRAR